MLMEMSLCDLISYDMIKKTFFLPTYNLANYSPVFVLGFLFQPVIVDKDIDHSSEAHFKCSTNE
jgi:hypothetical protein